MIFSKLIPGFIRKGFQNWVKKKYQFKEYGHHYAEFLEKRKEEDRHIPKPDLDEKHIRNLKVLTNRKELLKLLPKNAVCSEIGVNEGEFSKEILDATAPQKFHLVDAWGDAARYHDGLKLMVREKFNKEISTGQVEVNVGFSTDKLKEFSDHYFDWVYLDTDHSYAVTAAELKILKDKVKPGGIIAGHDYIVGNWVGDCRYGVIEAVHELCVYDNWELIYITINKNEMPSFAIKKISSNAGS